MKGQDNINFEYVMSLHCTMCTLYSFFSFRPSAVGHIVQPRDCHIIEHIFVPTHSVERNNEKIRFPWASNSKFVIFPQIFPCSNYKICPIIPPLAMVIPLFPRSNYRGFFTTGESYCTMYTLCNGQIFGFSNGILNFGSQWPSFFFGWVFHIFHSDIRFFLSSYFLLKYQFFIFFTLIFSV